MTGYGGRLADCQTGPDDATETSIVQSPLISICASTLHPYSYFKRVHTQPFCLRKCSWGWRKWGHDRGGHLFHSLSPFCFDSWVLKSRHHFLPSRGCLREIECPWVHMDGRVLCMAVHLCNSLWAVLKWAERWLSFHLFLSIFNAENLVLQRDW